MISGTSHDAIDVAAADLVADGTDLRLTPLGHLDVPFDPDLRAAIVASLPPNDTTMEQVCRLDTLLGRTFAEAAVRGVRELAAGHADLIVSHGQTTYHWVEDNRAKGTLQLGQPAWIAEATDRPVLSDLRSRDIAVGGHGAPLVSAIDVLLLGEVEAPQAALNLGGISNLTIVGPDRDPLAFDVGPANALMDAAVSRSTGGRQAFDRDGTRASRGAVDRALLERFLDDPYYRIEPPRSTGKEHFHGHYLDSIVAAHAHGILDDDLLATLAELTAVTVAEACRSFEVVRVVAAGGGVRNPVVMGRLGALLPGVELTTIEELGLPADAKEAYAFAVLGFLSTNRLPGAVATCTGASEARVLGSFTPDTAGRLPVRSSDDGWRPRRLRVEAGP
jgi:anhydro-N-acetylmuramic acid kinase